MPLMKNIIRDSASPESPGPQSPLRSVSSEPPVNTPEFDPEDLDHNANATSSIAAYDLKNIVRLARKHAEETGIAPGFLVKSRGDLWRTIEVEQLDKTTREVERVEGELTWVDWGDGKSGFWQLDDSVVKYIHQSPEGYRRFYNYDEYGNEPVGWALRGHAPQDESIENKSDENAPRRSWRQRDQVQVEPYKHYKSRNKRKSTESVLTSPEHDDDEDVDNRRTRGPKSASVTRSKSTVGREQQKSPDSAVIVTEATLFTTVRGRNSLPMPLRMTNTAAELFQKISDAFAEQLEGGHCATVAVRCEWKAQNIEYLVESGVEDTFATLVEDIRRAPGWGQGKGCEVQVIIERTVG